MPKQYDTAKTWKKKVDELNWNVLVYKQYSLKEYKQFTIRVLKIVTTPEFNP